LNKVGDSSVSPYLLQRLRSIDEVTDDRGQRRGGLDTQPRSGETPTTADTGVKKTPVAADSLADSVGPDNKSSSPRVDQNV
jgi:hypothetical protein